MLSRQAYLTGNRLLENEFDLLVRLYRPLSLIGEEQSVTHSQNAEVALRLGTPIHLVQFVLAMEDKRFWVHPGIDPIAIGRAAIMCLLRRGRRQGASTIPEQVLKLRAGNTHYTDLPERVRRAGSGLRLIFQESRTDVFVEYLQNVYLGRSCYGVAFAARTYFNRSHSELTPPQSFFISERIASPNTWRSGRLRNILRRVIIRKLLGFELKDLPMIYGKFFGQNAQNDISMIISQLTHIRTDISNEG
jgi:membrane peptidoglycan carboxypeptidase